MNQRLPTKLLGLSLLVLAVMAVSASGAQAEWLLLRNKVSVKSLQLLGKTESGTLLVPSLGLAITCEKGTGEAKVELSEGNKKLSGTVAGKFTGCVDKEFGEVCTVKGVGDPVGTISAQGSGEATMKGAAVQIVGGTTAFGSFANVVYGGAECPLVEIDGKVTGSGTLEVLDALEDLAVHSKIKLVSASLFFGKNPASIHNGSGGAVSGSATEVSGATFAVHLVNL